jgi:hypothetical protein
MDYFACLGFSWIFNLCAKSKRPEVVKCFTCVSVSLYAGKELVDVRKLASICLCQANVTEKIQQVFSLGNAVY